MKNNICFILLSISIGAASAQSDSTINNLVPDSLIAPMLKRSVTKNPYTLATSLTLGIDGEKEKFDAIYTWVVSNIYYDYKRYNSGRSFSETPLKKILRRRKGICTDYSRLMDTLCHVVGITNTTINGYVKEIIFNVNDSIYFDNHAWNAVRFGNDWYLYDATWSAGGKIYDYTKFGKWRLRQLEKLWKKVSIKTISLRIKKKGDKFCGIPRSKELNSVEVKTLPFVPYILIRILNWPRFRLKEKESHVLDTYFYLTDPDVFVLDHFPNDPKWALTSTVKNVSEFSADSSYYYYDYRSDSLNINQNRRPKRCISCDYSLLKEPIEKEKALIRNSHKNNPNNHMVPGLSNLNIADIFLTRMINEDDSITKMSLFDSTLYYIELSKDEFKESSGSNRLDSRFHYWKNKVKRNELLKQNKQYWKVTLTALRETQKREVKVRSLTKKAKNYGKRGKQDYRRFDRAIKRHVPAKKLTLQKIVRLKTDLRHYTSLSDSISEQISTIQDSLYTHIISLWANVLTELDVLNPLVSMYSRDGSYRAFLLWDNFDKDIREIRERIDTQVNVFASTIDKQVLQLSDSTYREFMLMNRLIKTRNAKDLRRAKLLRALHSGNIVSTDGLELFVSDRHEAMKQNSCWNTDNRALLEELIKNFKFFSKQTKYLYKYVRNNDALERSRYALIYRHITRNKSRLNDAIVKNQEVLNQMKRELYLDRNAFLKKLREEQE